MFEPPTLVAGFDDVAMVGESIEQCRGHLGVDKDLGPFAEVEISGHQDRGALVQPADQVEQELPS